MRRKKLPDVEPVRLKSLFGMEPGKWLSIMYLIILVLVIFVTGILPDLISSSKRVSFTSAAYNAAVYCDGNYIGGTPFTVKVPSGHHNITYSVNGCEIDSFEIKVKKAVFYSWLFPRKMKVESKAILTEEAYKALVTEFLSDVASYSAITDFTRENPYPELFTGFTHCCITSDFDMTKPLKAALCFVTSQEMKKDAEKAFELAGLSFDFDGFDFSGKRQEPDIIGMSEPDTMTFKGLTVKEGIVSERLFSLFVSENPQWNRKNADSLTEQGLTDSYYLADVNLSNYLASSKPVVNVSWHAAQAFCEWMSKESGKNVKLPSEKEWLSHFSQTENNVSQFTSTLYVPHPELFSGVEEYLENCGADCEVVVKGTTRNKTGVLPKNLCSDFTGFPIIWN